MRLGLIIAVLKFITIVEEVYLHLPLDDNWFPSFIESFVQQAMNSLYILGEQDTLGDLKKRNTIATIIMRSSLLQSKAIFKLADDSLGARERSSSLVFTYLTLLREHHLQSLLKKTRIWNYSLRAS